MQFNVIHSSSLCKELECMVGNQRLKLTGKSQAVLTPAVDSEGEQAPLQGSDSGAEI